MVLALLALARCGGDDGSSEGGDQGFTMPTKTFTHAETGFSLKYPETWGLDRATFKPPWASAGDMFAIDGVPTAINDPGSPAAAQELDRFVAGQIPGATRSGLDREDAEGGAIAVHRWTVGDAEIRIYARVLGGIAYVLFARAPKAKLDEHHGDLLAIARSFRIGGEGGSGAAAGDGERDGRLVGTWVYSETYMSGDFSGTYREIYQLNADGTFRGTSGANASLDNALGSVSGESGGASGVSGRWSTTGNNTLNLTFSDGDSDSASYYAEGNSLMIKLEGKNKVFNRR